MRNKVNSLSEFCFQFLMLQELKKTRDDILQAEADVFISMFVYTTVVYSSFLAPFPDVRHSFLNTAR